MLFHGDLPCEGILHILLHRVPLLLGPGKHGKIDELLADNRLVFEPSHLQRGLVDKGDTPLDVKRGDERGELVEEPDLLPSILELGPPERGIVLGLQQRGHDALDPSLLVYQRAGDKAHRRG
jgi:hypothetical protein